MIQKVKVLFLLVLMLIAGVANARNNRHIMSTPDPYVMQEVSNTTSTVETGYSNAYGRTLALQTIDPTKKTLIYFVAGQSNMTNMCPSAYVPAHVSQIDNLNPYDGAIYTMDGLVLGASFFGPLFTYGPGAIPPRVAEHFIAGGKFDRVIIADVAVVGTSVALWGNPGATLYDRIDVVMKRFAARGITCSTTGVTCAMSWGQGEGDTIGTSNYVAYLNGFIAKSISSGFNGKFFINVETWFSGTIDPNIQAAQIQIRNGTNILAGAVGDLLNDDYRNATDMTHFIDNGCDAMGLMTYNAMAPYY